MSVHQVHPNFTTLFTSVHFFLLKVNTKLENMKYSSELYLGTIFQESQSKKINPKSDIALGLGGNGCFYAI